MFRFLGTFLILFFMNHAVAQIDSSETTARNFKYGGRSGFYFTSYLPSFNYYAYFTVGFGIHEISIGPSIGRPPNISSPVFSYGNTGIHRPNGIDLTYRIMPNGPGRVFDFYFQADLFQKWGRGLGDDVIHNWPNLYDQTLDDVLGKSVASQLLVELGFDIKFLKYFYVGSSVGIGGKLKSVKFEYQTYSQFDYRETDFEPEAILRANFGARF